MFCKVFWYQNNLTDLFDKVHLVCLDFKDNIVLYLLGNAH